MDISCSAFDQKLNLHLLKMKKVMIFQPIKILCEMIMINNRYVAKTLSKALKRLWSVLLWYFVVIMWTEEFGQSLSNKVVRLALFIKQSLIFWKHSIFVFVGHVGQEGWNDSILEKGTCKPVCHQNVCKYFNNAFNYLIKLVDPCRISKESCIWKIPSHFWTLSGTYLLFYK